MFPNFAYCKNVANLQTHNPKFQRSEYRRLFENTVGKGGKCKPKKKCESTKSDVVSVTV